MSMDEALILDPLAQKVEQDAMIDVVEKADHIDVHHPLDPVPAVLDYGQRGVT